MILIVGSEINSSGSTRLLDAQKENLTSQAKKRKQKRQKVLNIRVYAGPGNAFKTKFFGFPNIGTIKILH